MNLYFFPFVTAAFLIVYFVTPRLASLMVKRGFVGVDVHKLDKPKIPEICGLALWLGVLTPITAAMIFDSSNRTMYLAFILTGLLAGLVGLADDIKPMNPVQKPVLTAFAAAPIIILQAYEPFPHLPFIGMSRLTIVYPILIFIAIAVTSNAVNMMDVFNGVMPGTSIITFALAFIALMFLGRGPESFLALSMLMALAAFYLYNRFPAKVFSGDAGSLFTGACLGAVAIIGRIEVVMVVAIMPQIMNAFYGLSSIGRLYEHRDVKVRPVEIRSDGRLDVSRSRNAPLTLTRIILAGGPLMEKEIVRVMMLLTLFSCALAAVTFFLTPW